jgi:hypothetical protein
LPVVLAIVAPSTATFARALTSASVYQRPLSMRVFISGRAGSPQACASRPSRRTLFCIHGCASRTPSVEAIRRPASAPSGLLATAWIQTSKWLSSKWARPVLVMPAPSESSASRVATATEILQRRGEAAALAPA